MEHSEPEARCPTCGALLAAPGVPCRFCEEARRLLERLAAEQPIRLCARCGSLLDEAEEGDICASCRLAIARPSLPLRRDDRIAAWIERLVEPPAAGEQWCPGCGRAIPATALYCPQCGTCLVPSEAQPPGGSALTPAGGLSPETREDRPSELRPAAGRGGFWQRTLGSLRNRLHPGTLHLSASGWLWLLVSLLLLGLFAMGFYWAQLLRSGDIFFR
ncbi:MAG: hypothetical protein ACP5SI_03920 [Chloroflexia bacterium]